MENSLYESHWFKGFHVSLNPIFLGRNDVIDDATFDKNQKAFRSRELLSYILFYSEILFLTKEVA